MESLSEGPARPGDRRTRWATRRDAWPMVDLNSSGLVIPADDMVGLMQHPSGIVLVAEEFEKAGFLTGPGWSQDGFMVLVRTSRLVAPMLCLGHHRPGHAPAINPAHGLLAHAFRIARRHHIDRALILTEARQDLEQWALAALGGHSQTMWDDGRELVAFGFRLFRDSFKGERYFIRNQELKQAFSGS